MSAPQCPGLGRISPVHRNRVTPRIKPLFADLGPLPVQQHSASALRLARTQEGPRHPLNLLRYRPTSPILRMMSKCPTGSTYLPKYRKSHIRHFFHPLWSLHLHPLGTQHVDSVLLGTFFSRSWSDLTRTISCRAMHSGRCPFPL
jgi:hypothetical protein